MALYHASCQRIYCTVSKRNAKIQKRDLKNLNVVIDELKKLIYDRNKWYCFINKIMPKRDKNILGDRRKGRIRIRIFYLFIFVFFFCMLFIYNFALFTVCKLCFLFCNVVCAY